jgi:hypothetical protein
MSLQENTLSCRFRLSPFVVISFLFSMFPGVGSFFENGQEVMAKLRRR